MLTNLFQEHGVVLALHSHLPLDSWTVFAEVQEEEGEEAVLEPRAWAGLAARLPGCV